MKISDWIKKKSMNARQLADEIGYDVRYIYRICSGKMVPGKKLAFTIASYTKGEVMPNDMGYVLKEKCQCPTCGRWS